MVVACIRDENAMVVVRMRGEDATVVDGCAMALVVDPQQDRCSAVLACVRDEGTTMLIRMKSEGMAVVDGCAAAAFGGDYARLAVMTVRISSFLFFFFFYYVFGVAQVRDLSN